MSLTKSILEQTFETSMDFGHNHVFTIGDTETSSEHGHTHKVTFGAKEIKISPSGEGPHIHRVVGE